MSASSRCSAARQGSQFGRKATPGPRSSLAAWDQIKHPLFVNSMETPARVPDAAAKRKRDSAQPHARGELNESDQTTDVRMVFGFDNQSVRPAGGTRQIT